MECVAGTSAISWLEKIRQLELLNKVYNKIWVPPGVPQELKDHTPVAEFIQKSATPIIFKSNKEERSFRRLVRRWQRKVGLEDIADIEVFISYRFFTEADEALYANKEAEQKLLHYGNVRDIARLYEIAETQNIFTRQNSITFLESFLRYEPPYRPQYISQLLKKLR